MSRHARAGEHEPVLLQACLAGLAIRADGFYVDGTYGRGGHAAAVLERLGPTGRLLAFDKDPDAVRAAKERFGGDARFRIVHGSFTMLERTVEAQETRSGVDGILLDLGVSSPQLDEAARGFSFQAEGPLDMRMDPGSGESAAEWLARAGEDEIARVLFEYGEERFSRRIARAIVERRAERPVATTRELAELIAAAVPTREKGKHPATRSFQALRILINKELDNLEDVLAQCVRVLGPGGRLCVISFHSLEDRRVKRFIRDHSRPPPPPKGAPRGLPVPEIAPPLRAVGKAVVADAAEVDRNPRARSAVLRCAERVAGAGE
ncbi:MAG TPA: 16S rRNA (cytosine(1402)-N(4))-methyltransferase RsmH [Gammaproteobacteria bacterium]